jgi:uncharacterized protein YndB with AHSA1/START domain
MAERKSDSAKATADQEIVITRIVSAPRELVWTAWTDPEQVVKWWGPKGFTTTVHMMDVRPGGVWHHTMHGPDGSDYPNHSTFIEVVKPERIVFSHGGGKKGGPGVQFESTWTFDALGDKTQVTIRMVFASAAERDRVAREFGAIEGGNQTLARLEDYVTEARQTETTNPMEREIVIERVFDAPRELVFHAWVDPQHLARWFGPKVFTIPVCETDARVGGAWHIVMRSPDGQEFPCGGVYREIVKPERLVFTNNSVDKEGNPVINGLTTVTFAEHDGKTKLTLRTHGTAMVDYAAAYLKGMEMGWTQSLEKLAEELATF